VQLVRNISTTAAVVGALDLQAVNKGTVVVKLPRACQLSYGGGSDPQLLAMIDRVPPELWGARLALQVLIWTQCMF